MSCHLHTFIISLEIKPIARRLQKACWETKAMDRRRGIKDEEILLTLCLYCSYGNSLIDTPNYALTTFSVKISDVGFMKRFKKCNEWIKWINQRMIQENSTFYNIPEKLKSQNVIAIDASNITSKGAVK